ncbi:MAG TPA: acylphosphatase [Bryobacteraceae bacterium]|nr:acylphosphatase [Bryobacteraceae bacterium]
MANVAKDDAVQARRFHVSGRVQGVGFRWFVEKHAVEIGVQGYTANLDDGRVEVYAIGTQAQLDELAGWLHRGPAMSEVREVQSEEAAPKKVSGFRIAR